MFIFMITGLFQCQIKLPFEKLLPALKNFPEDAMNPDVLLPMAFSIKVIIITPSFPQNISFFI